jgi:hypothetical protein
LTELRIAAICDEFTSRGLLHECHVRFLRPESWRADIAEFSPHVLFVESAWSGLGGSWQGRVCSADPVLLALVAHCRASGIPTIFWNKEDPVHFEDFIGTAAYFDAVCTTDADCIPAYKRDLGHDQVFLMPFAVQPRLHHPLTASPRIEGTVFAGAWYSNHAALSGFHPLGECIGRCGAVSHIRSRLWELSAPLYRGIARCHGL